MLSIRHYILYQRPYLVRIHTQRQRNIATSSLVGHAPPLPGVASPRESAPSLVRVDQASLRVQQILKRCAPCTFSRHESVPRRPRSLSCDCGNVILFALVRGRLAVPEPRRCAASQHGASRLLPARTQAWPLLVCHLRGHLLILLAVRPITDRANCRTQARRRHRMLCCSSSVSMDGGLNDG